MEKIVGIGEYAISEFEGDLIKTFALASCVAITAYNPLLKVAGMIHIALPSPSDREEGLRRPGYYATSGIPLLINKMGKEYGSRVEDLQIKIFGGALSIRNADYFTIGSRNCSAVRDTLVSMNLRVLEAQTGGTVIRNIEMDVQTGLIIMKTLPINF
ncbi:MAG: archease [Desulfosporosinus sp. BRH_c37]|nr:MAG: archease [Desulfosporosinus sp. BRH_c37]